MKILTFSDLHLEFDVDFDLPDSDADVLILAGDIITFGDYSPIEKILNKWDKPVIFIAGNHEFYTRKNMIEESDSFKTWVNEKYPNVHYLQDEAITIDGVHFFGGTMWTNFHNGSKKFMLNAQAQMNDFKLIYKNYVAITPEYTMELHDEFVKKITAWFENKDTGSRVVVSHHAPCFNPITKYAGSQLTGAFNSLDMIPIIEKYQPDLWIYGHTHECDDQKINKTRIISNQTGYQQGHGYYECQNEYDPLGKPIEIK